MQLRHLLVSAFTAVSLDGSPAAISGVAFPPLNDGFPTITGPVRANIQRSVCVTLDSGVFSGSECEKKLIALLAVFHVISVKWTAKFRVVRVFIRHW